MPVIGKNARVRVTERLRLEPITSNHAEDYFLVFQDDAIATWYAGKPTRAEAQQAVIQAEHLWQTIGFHKWLVYEHATGAVVGRAGISAIDVQAYNGAIRSFLPNHAWADEKRDTSESVQWARRWCEIGWALRSDYWGRGYAAEVGRAGLQFAFRDLDMHAVASYTERHNRRSQSVMERIGMRYAGEFLGAGLIEGRVGIHDEAPFALHIALREHWH